MIIGAAFTAIVSSLVGDIFTPIIGFLVPEGGFAALNGIGPGFNFGNFINALITFFITALCLFMVVKAVNGLKSIGKKKRKKSLQLLPQRFALTANQKSTLMQQSALTAHQMLSKRESVKNIRKRERVKKHSKERFRLVDARSSTKAAKYAA